MSDKRKRLIRQLMAETGRSYQSILNELRRGALKPSGTVTPLRPLVAACVGASGAGKSTAAILCANEWLLRGRRVLLIDGDKHQQTASKWALATEMLDELASFSLAVSMDVLSNRSTACKFDIVICDAPSGAGQQVVLARADVAIVLTRSRANWEMAAELIHRAKEARPQLRAVVLRNCGAPAPHAHPNFETLDSRLAERSAHMKMPNGRGEDLRADALDEARVLVDELERRVPFIS